MVARPRRAARSVESRVSRADHARADGARAVAFDRGAGLAHDLARMLAALAGRDGEARQRGASDRREPAGGPLGRVGSRIRREGGGRQGGRARRADRCVRIRLRGCAYLPPSTHCDHPLGGVPHANRLARRYGSAWRALVTALEATLRRPHAGRLLGRRGRRDRGPIRRSRGRIRCRHPRPAATAAGAAARAAAISRHRQSRRHPGTYVLVQINNSKPGQMVTVANPDGS